MLSSLHTMSPTSDQVVKDLLDQRAHASHTRYASVSFSQHSDSPSIYSRGDISPNPLCAPLEELPVRSGHPTSTAGQSVFNDEAEPLRRPPSALAHSLGSSDRYFTAYEDQADNDETSFVSAPTPRPISRRDADSSHVSGPELESPSVETIEDGLRMSLLGPKMRFVSRAPWEAGEEELLEADDEEADDPIDGLSIFGGKVGGWRGKGPEKSFAKGPGLVTFRSRSPGPPSAPMKKGTSMNFTLHRRKTPEPPSESPYGPYLTNASQSHSAINSTSYARSSHSVTDSQSSHDESFKAPIPRVASGPMSPLLKAIPPPSSPDAYAFRTVKPSFSSHDDSSTSSFRSESPPPPFRMVHPYANPDLLPGPPPSMPLPRTPHISQGHSSEERDRYSSPLRPPSDLPQSSRLLSPRKAPTGGIAFPTSHSWNDPGENRGLENKPSYANDQTVMSADTTNYLPSHPERKDGPMRNLISLDQARARVSHMSMVNAPVPRSVPTSTLVAGLGLPPGVVVESGGSRSLGHRSATIPFPHSDPPAATPQDQDLQHRRPRTMSSGKRMGRGSSTPRPDGDTVPAKTLKHKKSAFLKLFQGGKDKDREKELSKESFSTPRPPAIRAVSTPPQTSSNCQAVPPLPGSVNVKRVSPPLLSVVVTSPSVGGSGSLAAAAQGSAPSSDSPPRVRQASSPFPSAGDQEPLDQYQMSTPLQAVHLSPSSFSAPPSQTEFKALSLRPISTMFSAFPDLLSPPPPLSNPATARNQNPSPTTPGFETSRSNSMSTASDFPTTPTSAKTDTSVSNVVLSPTEDQSAIVGALQEQIVNSRKAWQRQIWELEGQIKDLKAEVEELRNTGECETCGKAKRDGRIRIPASHNYRVVDRPRPRMGGNTRSVFGGANDM